MGEHLDGHRVLALTLAACALLHGAAADEWGECATMPNNVFRTLNCDFTSGVDHWFFSSVMGTWTADSLNGYPSAPCGQAEASDPSDYSFTVTSECMPALSSTDYAFGLYSRTPGGATIACAGRIEEYVSGDCTGTPTTSPDVPFTPELNLWTSWAVTWTTDSTTNSARGIVECSADASFTVLFDNVATVPGGVVPVELQSFQIE